MKSLHDFEKKTRKNVCTACTFEKNGVKTRKAIPHTCGKSDKSPQSKNNVKY